VARPRIAGLITAAGLGRRAGGPKAERILSDDPRPLLERCICGLFDAGAEQVFAVVRSQHAELAELAGAISICPDPAPAEMIDSVLAGLVAIEAQASWADGLLLCPVDAPRAAEFCADWLLEALANYPDVPLVPAFGGRSGHPAWLPRRHWSLLSDPLAQERGAQAAFVAAHVWPCTDRRVLDNNNRL
jgi:CTP:molybdopterin cytidylyltransferase MocA